MKTRITSIAKTTLLVAICLLVGKGNLRAQDGPPQQAPPDRAQMRERMLERLRDQLEVTDDTEWKAISEKITKVLDARRGIGGFGGPGGFFGGPPPGGPGGPPPGGGFPPPGGDGQPNPADRPGGFGPGAGGPPGFGGGGPNRAASPESEALRQAIDSKASAAELKTKIQSVVNQRKQKQAELEKAQSELRQLLSVRQEAVATMAGLL
jgi:hypothetical protein